jgi:hypothetical protein
MDSALEIGKDILHSRKMLRSKFRKKTNSVEEETLLDKFVCFIGRPQLYERRREGIPVHTGNKSISLPISEKQGKILFKTLIRNYE